MKLLFALYILVFSIFFPTLSFAGGLNRIATTGPTNIGNGSDPSGPWFPSNLGSKLQLQEKESFEFGGELMVPKLTYKDRRGHKFTSKNVVIPYAVFIIQPAT